MIRSLLQNGTGLPSEAVCADFAHTAIYCNSSCSVVQACLDDDVHPFPTTIWWELTVAVILCTTAYATEQGIWGVSLNFTKFGKVPTCWFQGTYAHLQCFLHVLQTIQHVRDAVQLKSLPDVLRQSPHIMRQPLLRCRPASLMMRMSFPPWFPTPIV